MLSAYQVQIFDRLAEKEALHSVLERLVHHVMNGRKTASLI